MKYRYIVIVLFLIGPQLSAAIRKQDLLAVETKGFVLTKTQLAIHISTNDRIADPPPATYGELLESPVERPDYIVIKIRPLKPVNISGILAVKIDGKGYIKQQVFAHRGPHWVEYFIPRDAGWIGPPDDSPKIELEWLKLLVK